MPPRSPNLVDLAQSLGVLRRLVWPLRPILAAPEDQLAPSVLTPDLGCLRSDVAGSVVDCGAYRVDSWTAVRAGSRKEPKTRAFRAEQVNEALPHGCELSSLSLEIPPRKQFLT